MSKQECRRSLLIPRSVCCWQYIVHVQTWVRVLACLVYVPICLTLIWYMSGDSLVTVVTLWVRQTRGWLPTEARFPSSPKCPHPLWGPHNLLLNGYWGPFPRILCDQGMKLTTHPNLLRGQDWVELYVTPPRDIMAYGGSTLTFSFGK